MYRLAPVICNQLIANQSRSDVRIGHFREISVILLPDRTTDGHHAPVPVDASLDLIAVRVRHRRARVVVEAPARVVRDLQADLAPATTVEPVGSDASADVAISLRPHRRGWVLSVDGREVESASSDPTAPSWERLASEVHLALATHAPRHVFVHAGAVAWRGAAIVAPGPSRAGKSTLVRALLAHGAALLSDEYAIFDQSGMVVPYARPVHRRRPHGTQRIEPGSLGPVGIAPHPLAVVVHTAYVPGARWSPESARSARVIVPLVANAVAARTAPGRVFAHLTSAARQQPLLVVGARGDADEAAAALLALADETSGRG